MVLKGKREEEGEGGEGEGEGEGEEEGGRERVIWVIFLHTCISYNHRYNRYVTAAPSH